MQRLRFSKYTKVAIILLDLILLMLLFCLFFESKHIVSAWSWKEKEFLVIYCTFIIGIWLSISTHTKLYTISRNLTYTLFLEKIIVHTFLFCIGFFLLDKLTGKNLMDTGRMVFTLTLSLSFILIKSFVFFLLKYIRQLGINHRNGMFLGGNNETTLILENTLKERKDYGYRLFSYPHKEIIISELVDFWKKNGIHTLFLSMQGSDISNRLRKLIFAEASKSKINIIFVPEIDRTILDNYELNYIESIPVLVSRKLPLDYIFNRIIKRGIDIAMSALVLVGIGSWLFPIISLAIWLDNRGPIFFVQKRYGKNQKIFRCIKFRTMVVNPHSSTSVTKVEDKRITKLGKLLRKTSLDEMPQFINVLLGQMSVVGPRPHMLLVDDHYRKIIHQYDFRSSIKPGVTGLAQVSGLRGDSGNMNIEMKKRILADSFYIKNWSIALDFIIILKTVVLFIQGDEKAR